MNILTHRIHSIGPCLALALVAALSFSSPTPARAADPTDEKPAKEMACCKTMREHNDKFLAEMKAQDAELAAQVTQMNQAPADKKLDLLAGIVTRLVEQRAAMNVKMSAMRDERSKHMMAHMHAAALGPHCCCKACDMDKDEEEKK